MAASNLEPAVWSSPNGVLSEVPCRFAVVERAVANAVITDAAVTCETERTTSGPRNAPTCN